jgi:hypothetical protein
MTGAVVSRVRNDLMVDWRRKYSCVRRFILRRARGARSVWAGEGLLPLRRAAWWFVGFFRGHYDSLRWT